LPETYLYGSTIDVAGFGTASTGQMYRLMQTVQMKIISRHECDLRIGRLRGSAYKTAEKYLCGASNPVALMTVVSIIYQYPVLTNQIKCIK
jgi:hypothetical protein